LRFMMTLCNIQHNHGVNIVFQSAPDSNRLFELEVEAPKMLPPVESDLIICQIQQIWVPCKFCPK